MPRTPKAKKSPTKTRPKASPTSFDSGLADVLKSGLGHELAVGHAPVAELSPTEASRFAAFQSNLLSLISHEMRTPLMGVLNALEALDQAARGDEFVAMAKRNARRLQSTLSSLLDLAAIESGRFHPKLRELDWERLVRAVLGSKPDATIAAGASGSQGPKTRVLGDSQKLERAIELLWESALAWRDPAQSIEIRISTSAVDVTFALPGGDPVHAGAGAGVGVGAATYLKVSSGSTHPPPSSLNLPLSKLQPQPAEEWDAAWSQAVAGFEAGVASPVSAFAGVLQSENAFLSRTREGLGAEWVLAHEIARMHQGSFEMERKGSRVRLRLSIPVLEGRDALIAVLNSRAHRSSTEIGEFTLVLLAVEGKGLSHDFLDQVRSSLQRASDAAYESGLPGVVALVLDDCKPKDAPALVDRLKKKLGVELRTGFASCPAHGADGAALLSAASKALTLA